MTDNDLRNSAAIAEFSNWAAGIRDAVQQSLQPFSEAAAYVAARDCATGLRRRRSHAAYCQVRIQATSALSRKLDALTQLDHVRNEQHQSSELCRVDTSLRPLRKAAAVGTCAATSPPVFTGSQTAQILRRNERPPATQ
jgi:hypothetical protein